MADDWFPLKLIPFHGEKRQILIQRHNGPCSIIALANILLLRGDIALSEGSTRISFDSIANRIAEYILSLQAADASSDEALANLLEILPSTRAGLQVDVNFSACDKFDSQGSNQGELQLFNQARVELLHGWVCDRQDTATWQAVVDRAGSYDQAAARLAMADELLGGALLANSPVKTSFSEAPPVPLTTEQEQLAEDGQLIQAFIRNSSTQLSYAGLFQLASHLQDAALAALYRNNHLSVITSREHMLYTLVTDSAFLHEKGIVWQSLEDADELTSKFFDGNFTVAHPVTNWTRQRTNSLPVARTPAEQQDLDLALQLQNDEYRAANMESASPQAVPIQSAQGHSQSRPTQSHNTNGKADKKCTIA